MGQGALCKTFLGNPVTATVKQVPTALRLPCAPCTHARLSYASCSCVCECPTGRWVIVRVDLTNASWLMGRENRVGTAAYVDSKPRAMPSSRCTQSCLILIEHEQGCTYSFMQAARRVYYIRTLSSRTPTRVRHVRAGLLRAAGLPCVADKPGRGSKLVVDCGWARGSRQQSRGQWCTWKRIV